MYWTFFFTSPFLHRDAGQTTADNNSLNTEVLVVVFITTHSDESYRPTTIEPFQVLIPKQHIPTPSVRQVVPSWDNRTIQVLIPKQMLQQTRYTTAALYAWKIFTNLEVDAGTFDPPDGLVEPPCHDMHPPFRLPRRWSGHESPLWLKC